MSGKDNAYEIVPDGACGLCLNVLSEEDKKAGHFSEKDKICIECHEILHGIENNVDEED